MYRSNCRDRPPPGLDGAPHWHVYDAARNRFFRIGWMEFELLSRWRGGMQAGALCDAVARATALAPAPEDVEDVQQFLQMNELLRADAAPLRVQLHKTATSPTPSASRWAARTVCSPTSASSSA